MLKDLPGREREGTTKRQAGHVLQRRSVDEVGLGMKVCCEVLRSRGCSCKVQQSCASATLACWSAAQAQTGAAKRPLTCLTVRRQENTDTQGKILCEEPIGAGWAQIWQLEVVLGVMTGEVRREKK